MSELFGFEEPQGFGSDENQRGDAKKKNGQQKLIPPGPWDEFPALWDRLTVDGEELPGIATVTVERANRYDGEKAKGQHKGTRKFSGVDPAKIRIAWFVWESTDYDDLRDKALKKFEPDPTKDKPTSIKLGHAVLTLRGVQWVSVDKVAGPEVSDGIGKFEIDCTEVVEPTTKNATGTIKPGQNGTGKNNSPENSRCQQLAEEYKECQRRDATLAAQKRDIYKQKSQGGGGLVTGGATDSESSQQYDQAIADNDSLRQRNNDRMQQISDEQRRLGCSQTQVSSDPSAASPTAEHG